MTQKPTPSMTPTGWAMAGLAVAGAFAVSACSFGPSRIVTAQASYGHDLPVAVPVAPSGLDAPDGPMLNAVGGEIPRGVYTPPVETSGLDDPEPAPGRGQGVDAGGSG